MATRVHTGSDGGDITVYEMPDGSAIGIEIGKETQASRALCAGGKWSGCYPASDTADVTLPGTGWVKRGGPMIGDDVDHWYRPALCTTRPVA